MINCMKIWKGVSWDLGFCPIDEPTPLTQGVNMGHQDLFRGMTISARNGVRGTINHNRSCSPVYRGMAITSCIAEHFSLISAIKGGTYAVHCTQRQRKCLIEICPTCCGCWRWCALLTRQSRIPFFLGVIFWNIVSRACQYTRSCVFECLPCTTLCHETFTVTYLSFEKDTCPLHGLLISQIETQSHENRNQNAMLLWTHRPKIAHWFDS